MRIRTVAAVCLVAAVAMAGIAVYVVSQDTPAYDVKINTPSSQPGTPVPQPTGGAR